MMFTFSHVTACRMVGGLWFLGGVSLLLKGLRLLTGIISYDASTAGPLAKLFSFWVGDSEATIVLLIAIGLGLGFLKGRYALKKAAERLIVRVRQVADPAPLHHLFDGWYILLIAGAACMGYLVNHSGLTQDIHGVIDVGVGAALVNSCTIFFRSAALS